MSQSSDVPFRHPPARAAVLDLAAARNAADRVGPEEAEFIAALRRVLARTPAEDLWDKWRNSRPDRRARIFARFAD